MLQSCMFYRKLRVIVCVFSLSSVFYFIGDKIAADIFEYEITPSLKANDGIKFSQDLILNHVIDKGKPQCKLSYKILKEKYGYDHWLDIYPYLTLIQLKYYIDGIHDCVTVIDKWFFDSNLIFSLPLTTTMLYYFCINDNKKISEWLQQIIESN